EMTAASDVPTILASEMTAASDVPTILASKMAAASPAEDRPLRTVRFQARSFAHEAREVLWTQQFYRTSSQD
ncbi:MAG: hypothetical protein AAF560_31310, partial [Acidobacteriota bacterium]